MKTYICTIQNVLLHELHAIKTVREWSRSLSYCSWIYNYLQYVISAYHHTNVVSSNPDQAKCTRYNIMW